MNQLRTIRLSLEELAVSLSMLGNPALGKGILVSELGQISSEEERGRLSAATHTLMAKEILSLKEKKLTPAASFLNLITPLINCDFSIRCSRTAENELDQVLLFYFRQSLIVKHEIQHSVIHELTEVTNTEQVIKDTSLFFELDNLKPFSVATQKLTQTQLENARKYSAESVNKTKSYLLVQGFPDIFSQWFAEDLHEAEYRGSTMRVETSPRNELVSDVGFMLLKGTSGRLWFLEIIPKSDKPYVNLNPLSMSVFTETLQTLFITH